MAGPMQMYLYVHDAILRGVAGYEERAKHLDRDDADEVSALAAELGWFHTMIKAHEQTEEKVLFPAITERIPWVAETYLFDHDDFEPHVFVRLADAVAGVQHASGNGERKESADLLYRQSVALNEHMRLHITKENELLLPKVLAEFDVDEQARLAGAMAGLVDPPMMGALVGWMYAGQSADDREGMIRFLMGILPPPVFAGLGQMLAAKDGSAWTETTHRVPELATPSV